MASTVGYTEQLVNGGDVKIPLAQKICLMKANERTKEKAMAKLREVKAKSEDSGSKARQYLDGLLRIPFGIYRNEAILSTCSETEALIKDTGQALAACGLACPGFPTAYTAADGHTCVALCRDIKLPAIQQEMHAMTAEDFISCRRDLVITRIRAFNHHARQAGIKHRLLHSGKSLQNIKEQLELLLVHDNVPKIAAKIIDNPNPI